MQGFPTSLSKDVVAVVNGYERREGDGERTLYYIRTDGPLRSPTIIRNWRMRILRFTPRTARPRRIRRKRPFMSRLRTRTLQLTSPGPSTLTRGTG